MWLLGHKGEWVGGWVGVWVVGLVDGLMGGWDRRRNRTGVIGTKGWDGEWVVGGVHGWLVGWVGGMGGCVGGWGHGFTYLPWPTMSGTDMVGEGELNTPPSPHKTPRLICAISLHVQGGTLKAESTCPWHTAHLQIYPWLKRHRLANTFNN